jgi:fructose-specific phosphotransferase system IIC component
MMRFITHNLTSIDGIAIYPIISLLIFVMFFTIMITYVIRMKKDTIEELSAIPLEDENQTEFIDL